MTGQDFRQAFRSLKAARGFSLLAVGTIALGVAASTSIFSMVEGVLLRQLPYASGDRLVHIQQASSTRPDVRMSIPEIQDLRAQTHSMDAIVEYHSMVFQLYGMGEPQRIQTGVVSDNFFQILGVRPILGRLFEPGEEAVGAPPVVLLSHAYWTNALGADPKIIGAKFTMNDRVHTVVGVLPPLPTYPGNNDIWLPAGACPFRSAPAAMASWTARLPTVLGRIKPGVTFEQASSEMTAMSHHMHDEHPEAYPAGDALHLDPQTVREEMTAGSKRLLLILFSTAFFLMVVAAANFAGLSVARQLGRAREIAVREALGAGRLRIFAQLAIESLTLSLIGGALGTLLAMSGLSLLRSFATRVTPRAGEIQIDGVVLAFAVLTCVVVGLVAAAAPLIRLPGAPALVDRLRQGNSAAMGGKAEARIRRTFVFVQVTLAFVLLVGAGLLGRSLYQLQKVDAGYDGHNVLTARVSPNFTKYNTSKAVGALADQIQERLDAAPGMAMNAISNDFPLNNSVSRTQNFIIDGAAATTASTIPRAGFSTVSPRYFEVIGVPLKRGRAFTVADRDTLHPPVIISQRLATKYWAGRDPVGTRISLDSGKTWNPVVGIVGDVHQTGLDQDVSEQVYYPAAAVVPGDIRILVRYQGSSAPIGAAMRNTVHAIDPQQSIVAIQTLDDVRGARLSEPRLTATLLATFATVALVLAATGLAGVVGYSVTQRIQEIAIRLALGASRSSIVRLVGRDGLAIVVIALCAGGLVAFTLSRFVRTLLFGVQPNDLPTYAGVAFLLLVTSVLACLGPARRALGADPARALRAG